MFVLGVGGWGLCGAQNVGAIPCVCPIIDETIRELSVRGGALGCVRDRSGYETLNQLQITNYELRITEREELRNKTNRLYAASKSG